MDYKFILIFLTIILSGLAQVFLKKGSFYTLKDTELYILIGIGAILSIATFLLQAYLLKFFALSKVAPVITIGVMVLVVIFGLFIFGESISIKQSIGILLGTIAIYLILT